MIEFKNKNNFSIRILENGAIHSIICENILINQILGNNFDGSLNNIIIRILSISGIIYFPIIGPHSESRLKYNSRSICWEGEKYNIAYSCNLFIDNNINIIFWCIKIKNLNEKIISADVVFSQDLGIADVDNLTANEAYTCQYIDHTVLRHEDYGHIIFSRQNQVQKGCHPWSMIGALNKIKGFLTDGFQYYGLRYKETNHPEILSKKIFPNSIYQYEFALPTLQIDTIELKYNESKDITFYLLFEKNHPEVTSIDDIKKVNNIPLIFENNIKDIHSASYKNQKIEKYLFNNPELFKSINLSKKGIKKYFGNNLTSLEIEKNKILSFFYNDSTHVVLKQKEFMVERPHGHILSNGIDFFPSDDFMGTTTYMFGVFNSHTFFGNSNFNKIISISRNSLNIIKSTGQRIFIKKNNKFILLGVPSAFEMGLDYCKWFYIGEEETVIIKVFIIPEDPLCNVEIEVESDKRIEFLITSNHINISDIYINDKTKAIEFILSKESNMHKYYPESKFFIIPKDHELIDRIDYEGIFSDDKLHNSILKIKTKPVNKFMFAILGTIVNLEKVRSLIEKYNKDGIQWEKLAMSSYQYWKSLNMNIMLILNKKKNIVNKINSIIPWYYHNAMIHYSVLHGLEQFSGAAWGIRDVCQGPIEFFTATQNFKYIKKIIIIVFSHQYMNTGYWPQWFMLDKYHKIQQMESHQDVIIWPIKALCDYIEATNDFSILAEGVCYTDDISLEYTNYKETILSHTEKAFEKIVNDCIPDTSLLSYGGGDWDDTLQPSDPSMKKNMVSSWTVELLYQTIKRFIVVCDKYGKPQIVEKLIIFSNGLKKDFMKYLVKDDIVSGFTYFKEMNIIEYLLHPLDTKTGIKYRLLPMTRGIISEIFDYRQAIKHYNIIRKELLFPDGVRLMNIPATYNGGVQKYFKRAETSANFGREIGLQYIHAHIRYLEAMAKLGKADDLWNGILAVIPININKSVKKAKTRQSNMYFSSSDADFQNRYQAQNEFYKIKKNHINFKGGWKIYSSGPGIFINTLISHVIGIRYFYDSIIFDPVLTKKMNQLRIKYQILGKIIIIHFIIRYDHYSPKAIIINNNKINDFKLDANPYRKGGLILKKETLLEYLNLEINKIEIIL